MTDPPVMSQKQQKEMVLRYFYGHPRWLSGLAPPSVQGVILEMWSQVPSWAPCMEPASPSACVSLPLSPSLSVSLTNK